MQKPRQLKVVGANDSKLGQATIMDRALAHRYGAPYIHLAAFAIDIDRVNQRIGDQLPFAWEVWLTEFSLKRLMDSVKHDPTSMLEDTCLAILDLPRPKPGELGALGGQLAFALYTAVARGIVPARLGHCFAVWKKPPVELIDDVAALEQTEGLAAELARRCLEAPLDPPLVAPVRAALEELAAPSNG